MCRIYLNLQRRLFSRDRRGVVAILFALALLPIVLIVALAIDFSFFIEARSQLNLAADAAAMHAVRVASQAFSNGASTLAQAEAAGTTAGQQWFSAQLGTITTASVPNQNVIVNVTYEASPPGFVASVAYSGSVATHLGHFLKPTWTVNGNSSSIVSSAYLEVLMLIDNSSSMLIGATDADINTLQNATPCSTQAGNLNNLGAGQPMQWSGTSANYSWIYNGTTTGYGQGLTAPKLSPQNGACDGRFDGTANCTYPPKLPGIVNGMCSNSNGGVNGVPQAPCALACHVDPGGNDYYGLARNLGVTLRLDVIHQAAAEVIQAMQTYEEVQGQYAVGVYEFNSTLQQQYPQPGTGEASTDLAMALTTVQTLNPPVTGNVPQTYFATTANALAASVTPAGDGSTVTAPLKNIIIVTDGIEDDQLNGRTMGPITNAGNETICRKFKDLGFTVFVLYTSYLPVPNEFYLGNIKPIVEPTNNSAVTQALAACASAPEDFFQASNTADIKTAMQNILKAAINGPGRVMK
jgi:Flp pilus assembly protein TadG